MAQGIPDYTKEVQSTSSMAKPTPAHVSTGYESGYYAKNDYSNGSATSQNFQPVQIIREINTGPGIYNSPIHTMDFVPAVQNPTALASTGGGVLTIAANSAQDLPLVTVSNQNVTVLPDTSLQLDSARNILYGLSIPQAVNAPTTTGDTVQDGTITLTTFGLDIYNQPMSELNPASITILRLLGVHTVDNNSTIQLLFNYSDDNLLSVGGALAAATVNPATGRATPAFQILLNGQLATTAFANFTGANIVTQLGAWGNLSIVGEVTIANVHYVAVGLNMASNATSTTTTSIAANLPSFGIFANYEGVGGPAQSGNKAFKIVNRLSLENTSSLDIPIITGVQVGVGSTFGLDYTLQNKTHLINATYEDITLPVVGFQLTGTGGLNPPVATVYVRSNHFTGSAVFNGGVVSGIIYQPSVLENSIPIVLTGVLANPLLFQNIPQFPFLVDTFTCTVNVATTLNADITPLIVLYPGSYVSLQAAYPLPYLTQGADFSKTSKKSRDTRGTITLSSPANGFSRLTITYYALSADVNALNDASNGQVYLPNYPIIVTQGSNVVQVLAPDHRCITGDKVTLSGIITTAGLTPTQLNGTFPVTVLSGDLFSYVAPANATGNVIGGGTNVLMSPQYGSLYDYTLTGRIGLIQA